MQGDEETYVEITLPEQASIRVKKNLSLEKFEKIMTYLKRVLPPQIEHGLLQGREVCPTDSFRSGESRPPPPRFESHRRGRSSYDRRPPRRFDRGGSSRHGDGGSAYGDNVSAYGDSKSLYGDNASAYGDNKSIYGDNKSAYGDNRSAYGDNKSAYGDNKSAYGDNKSVYGNKSIYGEGKSEYGDHKAVYADNTPIAGGAVKSIYGDNKPEDKASSYGELSRQQAGSMLATPSLHSETSSTVSPPSVTPQTPVSTPHKRATDGVSASPPPAKIPRKQAVGDAALAFGGRSDDTSEETETDPVPPAPEQYEPIPVPAAQPTGFDEDPIWPTTSIKMEQQFIELDSE
eukprot:Gregarina_sp_Pseudo_9__3658@NODE_380_length_2990_cov_25_442562_g359_i0_p2_GENE_NODE_380_length_2990_cov_25_442562_g359_i0NODE_380_length_2990_cov_25_442562_g359_i0_p2_ORF_typecomplete_len345_score77_04DUF4744/PF15918_5/1DUF4744/PF15918_5/3_6e03Defb50/PF17546_2/1_1e02Defb50/PF17546_2/35Defb50/PF17546_2/1_3e02Defb50/PF17546_2/2_2e02Defb50/PF17546_2/2_3e03_NODE_380_length_2990_cov_25_442562_g359_i01011135